MGQHLECHVRGRGTRLIYDLDSRALDTKGSDVVCKIQLPYGSACIIKGKRSAVKTDRQASSSIRAIMMYADRIVLAKDTGKLLKRDGFRLRHEISPPLCLDVRIIGHTILYNTVM